MKRILIALFAAALLLTGCGVGSHTVVSGKPDEAAVIFFDDQAYAVDVRIDNNTYRVKTVKNSDYKKKRNIKKTADNMIVVRPGVHNVTVRRKGRVVLEQRIFVSAGDTKVINL